MKKLTDPQIEFVSLIEKSIGKLSPLIHKAHSIQFNILGISLLRIQSDLQLALDLQIRAFRDNSLVDPEPLFPQGQFPYGKKDNPLADALKRRFPGSKY